MYCIKLNDMSSIRKELSSTIREDGKSQIYLKVTITRTNRPRFKTGLFVNPEYFDYNKSEIAIPRKGKLNVALVEELTAINMQLEELCASIKAICFAGESHNVVVSKDWIIEVLSLEPMGFLDKRDPFSWNSIEKGFRLFEEKKAEAKAKEELEEQRNNKLSFWQLANLYIERNEFSISHKKGFSVLIHDLQRWEMFKQSEDPSFIVDADTLTRDNIEDFADFLRNEGSLKDQNEDLFEKIIENQIEAYKYKVQIRISNRGQNCIHKILTNLKTLFNWLINTERTNNNPFKGFVLGQEHYGIPYYLTLGERKKLETFDFSGRPALAIQRDIFVFQCLVGCRVSDLYSLTKDNITNGVLSYIPHKTKDEEFQAKPKIPLVPKALELIKKYEYQDAKGRLFPFISDQKYNKSIKKFLKIAEINRIVPIRNAKTGETEYLPICDVASSHMARRTFVGNLYNLVKDPNLIGKMSGHVEGSKAFSRYRDISDDALSETVNLIK